MVTDGWTGASTLFRNLSAPPEISDPVGPLRRLRDALATGSAGWRDIASLTRQILLEAQARGNHTGLTIPIDPRLPTRVQWEQMRCSTGRIPSAGSLRVSAEPWHPPVQETASDRAVADLREICLGQDSNLRRKFESYPTDPFFTAALGETYSHYVSVGQRQAARAVVLAEPGSTTIICLPTGHGKTAVAMAPALLASVSGGVSVVVVPTSVLAADLERRTSEIIERQGQHSPTRRYAYTSGLPDEVKKQMREDIAAGRQRLVFTSPEAVTQSLSKPLEIAAESGYLRYFIIDEAHLVEQWGNSFRTEFQEMAGYHRSWVRKAPEGRKPITVAMSATLTAQQVETLGMLFAPLQEARIVWASQLRHEPSYYMEWLQDEADRRAAVLDAVCYLPKPLILYTTKVSEAKEWADRLRDCGFRRVAHVTGDSTEAERRDALEGWQGRTVEGDIGTRYDIVVGTSAFGLGVDLGDVRTIVHACLPETVDRYYQEVGRAGRDGSPSIAYLVATHQDERLAEYMSNEAVIGAPRAWERWDAMFQDRKFVQGRCRVSINSYPPDMNEGFNTNQKWNVRILNLMARARLLDVHPAQPPAKESNESDLDFRRRVEEFYSAGDYVDVDLIGSDSRNRGVFLERFEEARQVLLRDRAESLLELKSALRGNRCIGEVLGSYYRIPDGAGRLHTGVTCRGCPHCRANAEPMDSGFYRLAGEPRPLLPTPTASGRLPLARYFGAGKFLSLWWQGPDDRALVGRMLESLVRRGVAVVGGPGLDEQMKTELQSTAKTRVVVIDDDGALLADWQGPVIWIAAPDARRTGPQIDDRFAWDSPTYLIHPRDLDHPERRGTPLIDIHPANLSIRRALEEL
ncbi:protein DpdF [Kitasatospora sp. NPDC085879]|uniref:protein DpdF n=1 Tax=Kitasatospora sp. NPDC085879 TaxID=3154769 RepID=UPI003413FC0B